MSSEQADCCPCNPGGSKFVSDEPTQTDWGPILDLLKAHEQPVSSKGSHQGSNTKKNAPVMYLTSASGQFIGEIKFELPQNEFNDKTISNSNNEGNAAEEAVEVAEGKEQEFRDRIRTSKIGAIVCDCDWCSKYKIKCAYCHSSWTSSHGLNIHISKHHKDKCASYTGPPVCDICGYKDRDRRQVSFHRLKKHGIPLPANCKRYTCEPCGQEFISRSMMTQHITHNARCSSGLPPTPDFPLNKERSGRRKLVIKTPKYPWLAAKGKLFSQADGKVVQVKPVPAKRVSEGEPIITTPKRRGRPPNNPLHFNVNKESSSFGYRQGREEPEVGMQDDEPLSSYRDDEDKRVVDEVPDDEVPEEMETEPEIPTFVDRDVDEPEDDSQMGHESPELPGPAEPEMSEGTTINMTPKVRVTRRVPAALQNSSSGKDLNADSFDFNTLDVVYDCKPEGMTCECSKCINEALTCPLCHFSSRAYQGIAAHIGVCHFEMCEDLIGATKCPECKYEDKSRLQVSFHRLKNHNTPLPKLVPFYKCDKCPAIMPSMSSFQKHLRVHENTSGGFKQRLSEALAARKLEQAEHYSVSGDPEQMTSVQQSTSVADDTMAVEDGSAVDTDTNAQQWECEVCATGGNTKQSLIEHMRDFHDMDIGDEIIEAVKSTPPDQIPSVADVAEMPEANEMEKTEADKDCPCVLCSGSQYACPLCHSSYISSTSRQAHIAQMHKAKADDLIGPIQCDLCSFKERDRKLVAFHRFRSHSIPLPPLTIRFTCEVCDFVSPTASAFKNHMKTHGDELTHHCIECGNHYSSASSLSKHMFTHQPVRDAYTCDECGHVSKSRYDLKIHGYTHKTSDKPFSCERCDYACTSRTKLDAHTTRRHKVATPKVRVIRKTRNTARR